MKQCSNNYIMCSFCEYFIDTNTKRKWSCERMERGTKHKVYVIKNTTTLSSMWNSHRELWNFYPILISFSFVCITNWKYQQFFEIRHAYTDSVWTYIRKGWESMEKNRFVRDVSRTHELWAMPAFSRLFFTFFASIPYSINDCAIVHTNRPIRSGK